MDIKRLQELSGMPLTEGININKRYPVIIGTYTAKQAFNEMRGVFADMQADGEVSEKSTFTIEMMDDAVMNQFVEGVAMVADRGGSDDRRADNYGDMMDKLIKSIVGE